MKAEITERLVCKTQPYECVVYGQIPGRGAMTYQCGSEAYVDEQVAHFKSEGYRVVTPDYFGWRRVFRGATE